MKKGYGSKWCFFAAALTLFFFMAFIPHASGAKLAGKSVKLGSLLPMTGIFSDQGLLQKIAVEIAQEEINASGGIGGLPLETTIYDTKGKPEDAVTLTRKLSDSDKVLAIAGPFSSTECETAFPVANRSKIPMISASSAKPGVAEKNRPWAFRVSLPSDKSLVPTVKKWKEMYNIKTAAIIYDSSEALMKAEGTIVFPQILKDNDIKILDSVSFVEADIDYSAQITRVKTLNPDGLVFATSYKAGSNVAREARRQGMNQPIVGSTANMAPDYIRIGGKAAEGTISVAGAWEDNPDPKVQAFLKKFLDKSKGKRLDNSAWYIYDVMYMLKDVIEKSGATNKPEEIEKDREKIRDSFAQVKNYKGVSGQTSIRPDGDSDKEIYVVQVKDGKWVVAK